MTSSALSLLNQKLPPYVINCPLSSGFDEIEVLCSMDSFIVSEKRGISIEKIKSSYIQKNLRADTQMMEFK